MSSQVRGRRPTGDNPWVCPNDRQLALRAKLKSGWSVKTSSLQQLRKPTPLNEREQHVIVNVIQKAESFEKKEQIRVGKLVERLDNMRRHAVGNGASTCVLCGEKFGLLASSKLKCKDCLKAVCHKCVVDTSSAGGEQWLLCKICAETREVWKKSGAWFFKGMPRYVMPDSKRPPLANGSGARRRVMTADASSPRSSTRYNWAKHVQTGANGDPSTPASDGRTAPGSGGRVGPPDRGPSLVSQRSSSLGSERAASPPADSSSEDEDAPRRSGVRRVTTFERVAPQLASPAEDGAESSRVTANGDSSKAGTCAASAIRTSRSSHANLSRDKHRRSLSTSDSTGSDGDLSRHWSSGRPAPVTRHESVGDASRLTRRTADRTSNHGAAGTAEFSVIVDPVAESIHCCVHKVKALCPMDGRKIHAYVKLHLVPGLHKTNKLRTRTVAGSSEPEFNETLTYCSVSADIVVNGTLCLSVLDEDPYGHDVMGEALVRLSEVTPHRLRRFNKPLLPISGVVGLDCGEPCQGKILLSLKYVTSRHALVVGVVRCADLPALDGNGVPDPFVKVQLLPALGQFKTAIRWKSPNPKFNEEFTFCCRRPDLARHTLDLRVYDKDISTSNDFIGSLQLSIDSHGARLRHWFDALNYVDTRHDRWHELSYQLPGPPPS